MDSNYDDVSLQSGEDREFKNQFREFYKRILEWKKNLKKKKRKRKQELKNLSSKLYH